MSEPPPDLPPPAVDVRQLAFAIRFALVAIVLGLSYFGIRGSLAIGSFEQLFKDMLGGRPLPALTVLVVDMRQVFVVVVFSSLSSPLARCSVAARSARSTCWAYSVWFRSHSPSRSITRSSRQSHRSSPR